LLARLNKKGNIKTFDGGRTIVQELDYNNNQTFVWYSGYQTLNISPSQTFTAAEFPIRQAGACDLDFRSRGNPEQREEAIINLLEGRVKNGERRSATASLRASMVTALCQFDRRLAVAGRRQPVDRDRRRHRSVRVSFWQNISFSATTNGGAPTSAANIQDYMDALYVQLCRGNDHPDLIVADNNMYRFYLSSLQAIQRLAGDTDLAKLGFETLKYLNADVVLTVAIRASRPIRCRSNGIIDNCGWRHSGQPHVLSEHGIYPLAPVCRSEHGSVGP